jgi:hypothetical protein
MALNFETRQKQTAAEFWKSYFGKFRRPIEDHEVSETGNAPLSSTDAPVYLVSDRRRPGARQGILYRR